MSVQCSNPDSEDYGEDDAHWYWPEGIWVRHLNGVKVLEYGDHVEGVALGKSSGECTVKLRKPSSFWNVGTEYEWRIINVSLEMAIDLRLQMVENDGYEGDDAS